VKQYYSVEEYRIYETDGRSLALIDGWAVNEDGSFPVFTLQINGEVRDFRMVRMPQEEIAAKYSLPSSAIMCGFRLTSLFDGNAESLCLYGDDQVLLEADRKKITANTLRSGIVYYVDHMYADDEGSGSVSGWAFSIDGSPLSFDVTDKNGVSRHPKCRTYPRIDFPSVSGEQNRAGFQLNFSTGGNENIIIYTDKYKEVLRYSAKAAQRMDDSGFSRMVKKVNDSSLQRLKRYYKQHGLIQTFRKVINTARGIDAYHQWFLLHKTGEKELKRQRETVFSYAPLISIVVPTFNTPAAYLDEMIGSVQKQTYPNWQLCIADGSDPDHPVRKQLKEYAELESRIKLVFLDGNYGISGNTNKALELADGEYTGLFDHDDILEPDMLYEIVNSLQNVHHDVIYTDEDKLNSRSGRYEAPCFKPDFDQNLLRSENYITHFFVAKTALIKESGGFHSEYDGSQDFDLTLRCTEKADSIHHIAKVLYHWRMHGASTAEDPTSKLYCYVSGEKAVRDHLARMNIKAKVKYFEDPLWGAYQVIYESSRPRITAVLRNYASESERAKCEQMLREADPDIEILVSDEPLNQSVSKAQGEYVLILNGCIPEKAEALTVLCAYCEQKDTAVSAGMVLGADGMIHSSGLILGIAEGLCDAFSGMDRNGPGVFNKAVVSCEFSAVMPEAAVIRKEDWIRLGGLDETYRSRLSFADYCLRLRKENRKIVYCPYVVFMRSSTDRDEYIKEDLSIFRDRWSSVLENGDPYYNRNYERERGPWILG